MGQRKLTDGELQDVMHARHYLRTVMGFGLHSVYAGCVLSALEELANHGTTDGKPYVEPQPEIGEGYRVATEADKDRLDLEWVGGFRKWKVRGNRLRGYPLHSNLTYRVPVDRIPTDEDAKQRPTVMVRDRDNEKWNRATLYGVSPAKNYPFLCERSEVSLAMRQCRFPYPGELP